MTCEILIVDDEKDIRFLIRDVLQDENYSCREAHDSDSAIQAVQDRRPSLILLDIWLQGSRKDGLGILEDLIQDYPDIPVLMMSGHGTIETAVKAIKMGAYDFIEKPIKLDHLLLCVNKALDHSRLRRENQEFKIRFANHHELVGSSSPIQLVRQTIKKIAATSSRIFITGPQGSGKEIVARLIHAQSRRDQGPFIAINCAVLQPDRLEEMLFGSETSEGRKIGILEEAHGGTLFLDEIADMPIETQGKILRFLQDHSFERLGSRHTVKVDVRVVASTNKPIKTLIELGKFRADLFYRLNVVPIDIPPLCERVEDINDLVQFFVKQISYSLTIPLKNFTTSAVAALQTYTWPGNVRQLRNVVEWCLIMAHGDGKNTIDVGMLPPDVLGNDTQKAFYGQSDIYLDLPLREAREIFERQYLLSQINRFGGNISKTASFVGMERSALHRKLKSLQDREEERHKSEDDLDLVHPSGADPIIVPSLIEKS